MEFPRQGSDLSAVATYAATAAMPDPLIRCAGPGIKLHPGATVMQLIPFIAPQLELLIPDIVYLYLLCSLSLYSFWSTWPEVHQSY